MSNSCSCPAETALCTCAAQIIMANLDVGVERQVSSQGSAASTPLEIPPTSSSPNQSPKNSPRPLPRKETPRSDRSSGREVSPSQLDKPDSESQGNVSRSSESIPALAPELVRSTSQVSQVSQISGEGKERKESRSSDRAKKKSSWYSALTPSYKSRSEEFKRYFKDLPSDERLVVDYSCAVQKDLLIQGRMFVTQNYLCFYAIYFRWETCINIRWKDVTSVTKEKTALIIPNAIMISTEAERLFFTTFNARDKAYVTLFRVWQNALMDKPLNIRETWRLVHEAYGEELGLSSDDEYFEQNADPLDEKIIPTKVHLSADSLCEGVIDKSPSPTSASARGLAEPLIPEPTDQSDTTESDVERPLLVEPLRCPSDHEGRCFVSIVVPIHIDQLFTLLFTNSKFFLEFHAMRRTSDIKVTSWQPNPETGEQMRIVSMVVAISQALGPKSSNVQETQVMKACSQPGQLYVIDGDVVNSGIPYADSFYVDTHYCLVRTGDNETSLTINSQLKYKKTVWQLVKNVIEKNTWSNLEDFYESLIKSLNSECEDSLPKGRGHRRRARGAKPVLLPVQEIAPSLAKKVLGGDGERRSEWLVGIVLAILLFLLLLNTVLYYKLWVLEVWAKTSKTNLSQLDLEVLRNPPKTHDEWLQLFRQQESLHRAELARWQAVLQAAVRLLRRAEEALSGLHGVASPSDEL